MLIVNVPVGLYSKVGLYSGFYNKLHSLCQIRMFEVCMVKIFSDHEDRTGQILSEKCYLRLIM